MRIREGTTGQGSRKKRHIACLNAPHPEKFTVRDAIGLLSYLSAMYTSGEADFPDPKITT